MQEKPVELFLLSSSSFPSSGDHSKGDAGPKISRSYWQETIRIMDNIICMTGEIAWVDQDRIVYFDGNRSVYGELFVMMEEIFAICIPFHQYGHEARQFVFDCYLLAKAGNRKKVAIADLLAVFQQMFSFYIEMNPEWMDSFKKMEEAVRKMDTSSFSSDKVRMFPQIKS